MEVTLASFLPFILALVAFAVWTAVIISIESNRYTERERLRYERWLAEQTIKEARQVIKELKEATDVLQ